MRRVHDTRSGAPDITKIRPTVKSRDDIPAILIGLQDLYSDEGTRKRLSGLPGRLVLPGKSRRVGRPGMEPLTILVPGVVKQGPGGGHRHPARTGDGRGAPFRPRHRGLPGGGHRPAPHHAGTAGPPGRGEAAGRSGARHTDIRHRPGAPRRSASGPAAAAAGDEKGPAGTREAEPGHPGPRRPRKAEAGMG